MAKHPQVEAAAADGPAGPGRPPGPRDLVRTGTTVDDMVRSLADQIVTGRLPPGIRLDEAGLAARFEVSRTPVREALGQLGAMKLVDRRPNRGAVVAVLSQDRLAAMFEGMAELEGICARFAAERMTAAERRALEAAHQGSAKLVHDGAEEAYETHNTAFHSALYAGCHNEHIGEMATLTRDRLAPFRRAQFRLAGRLLKSWTEHDAIVAAIMRGDGAAAEAAAKGHVDTVGEASAVFASGRD